MISIEYINPFFTAVKKVCGETLHVAVTSGPLRLCKGGERVWKLYQVSAVIRLDSAVQGIVALSFAEPVALALASGLAGEPFTALNADSRDALGEVANLIVGSAKRDLPGGLVTISTP